MAQDDDLLEYIKKRIRQITPKEEKQPCFICGKYKAITELHHLIPVSEMARFVIEHKLFTTPLYIPTAWLCPNHHAIWHAIKGTQSHNALLALSVDMPEEELKRYTDLEARIDIQKILVMLKGLA